MPQAVGIKLASAAQRALQSTAGSGSVGFAATAVLLLEDDVREFGGCGWEIIMLYKALLLLAIDIDVAKRN